MNNKKKNQDLHSDTSGDAWSVGAQGILAPLASMGHSLAAAAVGLGSGSTAQGSGGRTAPIGSFLPPQSHRWMEAGARSVMPSSPQDAPEPTWVRAAPSG